MVQHSANPFQIYRYINLYNCDKYFVFIIYAIRDQVKEKGVRES